MVAGTFILNSLPARVLFDSGSTYSFVSTTFSNHLKTTLTPLDKILVVEVAVGKDVIVKYQFRECQFEIEGLFFLST